ncbi:transposable element Tcb1 transposase [Trichonephila clavipes]|nr:transposable element Tcb1 transposase [Trichonephila clavipes]
MRRYAGRRNGGVRLSSIKHVVGTTSGCFYPRSNHWEVGGRPQCDKCGCRVRIASQHRFTTLETISNYRNSYPGFSSASSTRNQHPADDRYIVLQARRNRRQTAGEIARHTTYRTDDRYRVLPWPEDCTVVCYHDALYGTPLTPAHRRRRLFCGAGNTGIEETNEWGRVLFTDESRFSLSNDSHRILIWEGKRNHPSNIIERDRYGGRGVLVWGGGIMLGSRTDSHLRRRFSQRTRYCNEILLPYVRLLEGYGSVNSFSWTTMHHVIAQ